MFFLQFHLSFDIGQVHRWIVVHLEVQDVHTEKGVRILIDRYE